MSVVRVGILGGGFMGRRYLDALSQIPEADVRVLYTPSEGTARRIRDDYPQVPKVVRGRDQIYEEPLDLVLVGLPNALHADAVIEAAAHGAHSAVDKPLCLTLEEADRMIEACRRAGVLLMYAENLCFAPQLSRLRTLAADGAFGKMFFVRQSQQHFGPHSDWFWDPALAGGGVLMDMGCHSLAWIRYVLSGKDGKVPEAESVTCHLSRMAHPERPAVEDHAITVVRFAGGVIAVAENSWARRGGIDNRAEVMGTDGVAMADMSHGTASQVYSEVGYGGAAEKVERSRGWTFVPADEARQSGVVGEIAHFAECVRKGATPIQTGEDGKAVLELMLAAYRSAGTGATVSLPYRPVGVRRPIDLYFGSSAD